MNLASVFSSRERGASTGTIDSRSFCSELAAAKLGLTATEEDLLISHYSAPGSNDKIDYRIFLEDIKNLKIKIEDK